MKKLNKKKLIILLLGIFVFIVGVLVLIHFIRIWTAKIEVKLVDDLTVEFTDKVRVSDFIESINGKIIDNYEINTTEIGNEEIKFKFVNDDNIKVKYKFNIEVVDRVAPLIWSRDSYTAYQNDDFDVMEYILCGDNYDNNPRCEIEGIYDTTQLGSYDLVYKATDSSGNESIKNLVINVIQRTDNDEIKKEEKKTIEFSDVVNTYKKDGVKIGIDISKWQGDIDFEKLKNAGVEFVMIRVGGTRGKDGEYFVDEKFEQNIKNANKYNIPAGIYYYSYAYSSKEAEEQAKWVINKIKKYDIDLPIAFDWEEWSDFNDYHLSFYGLTSMAETFAKTIEKSGYKGMIYSSKTYLENMWLEINYPIWLAHYADEVSYEGDYKMWQLCNNGIVDGISGDVDIDIMYE